MMRLVRIMEFKTMPAFAEIYERIKLATNSRTQVELAEVLDIRQSSISDAKRRNSVPGDWFMKLFEKFGIFTRVELESREEIIYETYAKTINIEAKAMIDIAGKQIIPAVIKYTTELGQSIATVKSACASADVSAQTDILTETSSLLAETQKALKSLETVTAKGTEMGEGKEQAVYYRDEVKSAMDALRAPVDKLEMIVDKDLWPMPSYGDLIFEV